PDQRPVSSRASGRPVPKGMASAASGLVTRTSVACGAHRRKVTRPSAPTSTERYDGGGAGKPPPPAQLLAAGASVAGPGTETRSRQAAANGSGIRLFIISPFDGHP